MKNVYNYKRTESYLKKQKDQSIQRVSSLRELPALFWQSAPMVAAPMMAFLIRLLTDHGSLNLGGLDLPFLAEFLH